MNFIRNNTETPFIGDFFFDKSVKHSTRKMVYATDASVYQEEPLAVALPKSISDLHWLVAFAKNNNTFLIPRAAGTSLAGQVVGNGVVVDISVYLTKILELNTIEKWVKVQPGVIRDDLNAYLKPHGLMFGPETSTASRAMIGGMIGNNSCGLHSIIWGNTRENIREIKAILSDGSEVVFNEISVAQAIQKGEENTLEGRIYRQVLALLQNTSNQELIQENFPKIGVLRRNTGYALDYLLNQIKKEQRINIASLVAGSEGTLCLITEAILHLIPLPPVAVGVVAVHCHSIQESLLVNLIALEHKCSASELVDDMILEQTIKNADHLAKRFFIEGKPKAILMVEFFAENQEMLLQICQAFIEATKKQGLGSSFPVLQGLEAVQAWDLRKAGLGLLRNMHGDTQPVNLIEDCAVTPQDLPSYIADLEVLLQAKKVRYSMYAHAGAGELHVEPLINLKTTEGQLLFREILKETTLLVKKYKGSLSGEHGDGRLRGEFISLIMGEEVLELFKNIKTIFDPEHIFNRGKITNTPSMLANLRYAPNQNQIKLPKTMLDFSDQENILRLTEKCSGSGDCRKTHITGGTMCPSYMATRSENDTTRARANILRQYLTQQPENFGTGIFAENTLNVLDICLGCKACKSECPSGVDIAKLRAEFLYQYQKKHGIAMRSWLIGNFSLQMRLLSTLPFAYNFAVKIPVLRRLMNRIIGFHAQRTLPKLSLPNIKPQKNIGSHKQVYVFLDEFSYHNDGTIADKCIVLLERMDYNVILKRGDSGRSFLSKGMLDEAKKIAIDNVNLFANLVSQEIPMIGIEPSAILSFRDEYVDLVPANIREKAKALAKNTWLFEEWFAQEIEKGNIVKTMFTEEKKQIKLHGHCHQKALSSMSLVRKALSFPKNYIVELIPSGCCGMAGAFGYEKGHYDISMKIGELVLFPAVRNMSDDYVIAASGTSCRHQIKDGTGKTAQHSIEILFEALV